MEKSQSLIALFLFILVAFAVMFATLSYDSVIGRGHGDFDDLSFNLNDTELHVAIADTNAQRQQGLGGIQSIATDEGMLFVFGEHSKWRIWMRDMLFGIDILWLDEQGRVVDMREYVYPESYPFVFEPKEPAKYILEVNVGVASANGISVGDVIDLGL